jgi:hypothetical protein
MSTDRWAYVYGKGDELTDRHDLYKVMGKGPAQRQRAYREYVCSNRDKEEHEVREKNVRGVILAAGFQEKMDKKAIEIKGPGKGRPPK